MALTTPISLILRGLTANSGVTTTLYPHSQAVVDSPVKVVHGIFHAPDAILVKGAAIAANDVFQVLSIPAGAFVFNVAAKVITAEGGACTIDVGDGATTDGYLDGFDANAATDSASFDGTTTEAFGSGKYYAAADTIDVKFMTGTATVVVVALSASYIMHKQLVVA